MDKNNKTQKKSKSPAESSNEKLSSITENNKDKKKSSNNKNNSNLVNEPEKEQEKPKNPHSEEDYNRLKEYINKSGLSLAFNIIFAELISKQIKPENFFAYTSMRLKEIGKELEGIPDGIEYKPKEEPLEPEEEEDEKGEEVFMTVTKNKKKK